MPRNTEEEFETWINLRLPEMPSKLGREQLKLAYDYGVFIGTPTRDYVADALLLVELAQTLLHLAIEARVFIPDSLRMILDKQVEYYSPVQTITNHAETG